MNKLVGDSPEMCRALDSHGFADLERNMTYSQAITSVLDWSDPRRFHMGTPEQVWQTMSRCWTVAPTSERIVEDILAFPRVLQKIFDARGCVVPDLFLRSGKRARRADGKGYCKIKIESKQRISTNVLPDLHPDVMAALPKIQNTKRFVKLVDEMDDEESVGQISEF